MSSWHSSCLSNPFTASYRDRHPHKSFCLLIMYGLSMRSRNILHTARDIITKTITHSIVYLSIYQKTLWQKFRSLVHGRQPTGDLDMQWLGGPSGSPQSSSHAAEQSLALELEAARVWNCQEPLEEHSQVRM